MLTIFLHQILAFFRKKRKLEKSGLKTEILSKFPHFSKIEKTEKAYRLYYMDK